MKGTPNETRPETMVYYIIPLPLTTQYSYFCTFYNPVYYYTGQTGLSSLNRATDLEEEKHLKNISQYGMVLNPCIGMEYIML